MSKEKDNVKKDAKENEHKAPKGSILEQEIKLDGSKIKYKSHAEWMILRKKEKPTAEMFHVAYIKDSKEDRPITFIFNGGPGAASAYLHLGAIGPKKVKFNEDGSVTKPPTKLIDNAESWLSFTDLVFIDPIGTGFSRTIEDEKDKNSKDAQKQPKKENKEYYHVDRDLESLGEFIKRFLSKHNRWESEIYVAGESYGGFRAAAMAKRLQENTGVGLSGTVIISPALEFSLLDPSHYDILTWMDLFPTMAAAAFKHGKSVKFDKDTKIEKVLEKAEEFATSKFSKYLIMGDGLSKKEQNEILDEISQFLGLSIDYLERAQGRIPFWMFAKILLQDERKICGIYDASLTGTDPFPGEPWPTGPDPSSSANDRVYTAGINAYLRTYLKVDTSRDYHLVSMDVHKSWKDKRKHIFESQVGATDELRYGMALNPFMKVFVCHGIFDLVTPYYSSKRLLNSIKLTDEQRKNLTMKNFKGGHMFYSWDESRKDFVKEMKKFYK